MNIKHNLLVSVSIAGLLIIALGTVGFFLASNSPAKADAALSNPPAALSAEQTTIDSQANNEVYFAETKDSPSGVKDYSSDDYGCDHDQAIDWSAED